MASDLTSILTPLRKSFYALRNGVIADTLRKGGLPHKYIFGLQLPQLKRLNDEYRPSDNKEAAELARTLWADRECREARLMACHLMPPAEMEPEEALAWAKGTLSREESDILAFRLLRYHPAAAGIERELAASADDMERYSAEALRRFL